MACHTSHFVTQSHECSRCGRQHNGTLPRGWGQYAGDGLLCDDCGESLTAPDQAADTRPPWETPRAAA